MGRRRTWLQSLRLKAINFYPPFVGAGIRVTEMRPAEGSIRVRMKLHWWNRNYFGTHYGGSLYSMCDPFFVLILAQRLGRDYIVWDKAAEVRFVRPGKGTVEAHFRITGDQVEELRQQAESADKVEPTFVAEVLDDQGELVAQVEKRLYIRKKSASGSPS
ncbi:MAG: DUF4442 domain-containing protein [Acidobacteriota bacterium]